MGNGKRLKEILDEKNIRVSELAKLTNMNQQTLYSIINRDYNIRFDFAFRIANALDIDVSEICDTDLYITADTLLKFQMAKTEKGESMKIKDEEISISNPYYSSFPHVLNKEETDANFFDIITYYPQNNLISYDELR